MDNSRTSTSSRKKPNMMMMMAMASHGQTIPSSSTAVLCLKDLILPQKKSSSQSRKRAHSKYILSLGTPHTSVALARVKSWFLHIDLAFRVYFLMKLIHRWYQIFKVSLNVVFQMIKMFSNWVQFEKFIVPKINLYCLEILLDIF